MNRLCTCSTSNPSRASGIARRLAGWALVVSSLAPCAWAQEPAMAREPVTLKVVAVNPSADKSRTVPVRIDLPAEVTPKDILEHGDLTVEFDDQRSMYFVHKADLTLAPKQTKVFEVVVRDVWFVPADQLTTLQMQTELTVKKLARSEYAESAQQVGDSILARLGEIRTTQDDETLSRKQRIGAYRRNLQTLAQIKEDLERMEKLLSFAGGPPIPEMLEESPLRSDAPSTTTTWLVIFLIVIFMGLLAGQFFFTWHRKVKVTSAFSHERDAAFPSEASEAHEDAATPTTPGASRPDAR